jgi:hypothetical protein
VKTFFTTPGSIAKTSPEEEVFLSVFLSEPFRRGRVSWRIPTDEKPRIFENKILGRGATGEVVEGIFSLLRLSHLSGQFQSNRVAIKISNDWFQRYDQFKRGAQLSSALRGHPNIRTTFGIWESEQDTKEHLLIEGMQKFTLFDLCRIHGHEPEYVLSVHSSCLFYQPRAPSGSLDSHGHCKRIVFSSSP